MKLFSSEKSVATVFSSFRLKIQDIWLWLLGGMLILSLVIFSLAIWFFVRVSGDELFGVEKKELEGGLSINRSELDDAIRYFDTRNNVFGEHNIEEVEE